MTVFVQYYDRTYHSVGVRTTAMAIKELETFVCNCNPLLSYSYLHRYYSAYRERFIFIFCSHYVKKTVYSSLTKNKKSVFAYKLETKRNKTKQKICSENGFENGCESYL